MAIFPALQKLTHIYVPSITRPSIFRPFTSCDKLALITCKKLIRFGSATLPLDGQSTNYLSPQASFQQSPWFTLMPQSTFASRLKDIIYMMNTCRIQRFINVWDTMSQSTQICSHYQARVRSAQALTCALRALGRLLADGAPTVGRG